MAITVFTDPHLGRTMQAHTTAASRQRMQDNIFQTALRALEGAPAGPKLCLGDLFDKYQNSERVIQQGMELEARCSYIMAGNHDLSADCGKFGSLELLGYMGKEFGQGSGCHVLLSGFGESNCYLHRVGNYDFVFIPHHTTDGLFQKSLDDAVEWARQRRITRSVKPKAYLCLHCNYDSGFAVDETALTLTRRQAKWLLDSGFDYILIGHDHHPREDWDGRVIVLGNTHPTGFGDITPKRILVIDDYEHAHHFKTVWSPDGRLLELDAEALLRLGYESDFTVPAEAVDFIDLHGTVSPDQVMLLSKAVRHLWQKHNPLAIRNRVEITKVTGGDAISYDFQSIDKVVLEDLQAHPELSELFMSYWGRTAPGLEEE